MPSPEMLKQLLDEFTQKQSSTQQEIKKTEQQLQELESQIDSYRKKLKFIAQDRQKVVELMAHWKTEGSVASAVKDSAPEPPTVKPAEQPAAQETSEPSTFAKVAGLRKEQKRPTPTPPPAQAAPAAKTEEKESSGESDDAVKSINDALRGLFS